MFTDRVSAGRLLAARLQHLRGSDAVVLGLPRGGVPVAAEIAAALHAPLDVVLVRKIGAPFQPELAIGAVADGPNPEIVTDDRLAELAEGTPQYVAGETSRQLAEIERRKRLYYAHRTPERVEGRTAILVDDGIATGATMRAAARSVRRRGAKRLVIAVPVAAAESLDELRSEVDEIVCLEPSETLQAIGLYYADFRQLDDAEVVRLLERREAKTTGGPA
jgi:putative phosphoribosyl transferase